MGDTIKENQELRRDKSLVVAQQGRGLPGLTLAGLSVQQQAERDRSLSLLRTRLLREMRERGWNRLAIMPLTPGAGGTTVAVDLALVIRRHSGTRVMLVDLDLANPSVAARLGMAGSASYAQTTRAGGDLAGLLHVSALHPNFAVLAPAAPEAEPAEFLQGQRMTNALQQLVMTDPAHVVLMDCAPLLTDDVGLAALPLADAVLLVADGQHTTAADMKECERLLVDMPPLMGVVLNRAGQ